MKNWISLFSLVLLLTFFASCGGKKEGVEEKGLEPNLVETEPNDSKKQAHAVSDGTIAKGFIGAKKDQDWYQIAIPADSSAIIRAELTGVPGINLKMELFDSDNEKLVDVNRHKESQGEILTNYGLNAGNYFLRVRELWASGKERKFNDTTAYILSIDLYPARAGEEFESNNKAISSNLIQSAQPMRGFISPYYDVDWFKIMLPQNINNYLELRLSGLANVDLKMEVYDPIEALLLRRDAGGKGEGETILNLGINPDFKFYYIKVRGGDWQTNEDSTYQLTATFIPYQGRMEIEPNNRMVRATKIARGDSVKGFFDTKKDIDWYQLLCFAAYPQVARIEAFGIPRSDLKLTLFSEDEEPVWSVNETGDRENEIITNIGLESSSNYFLKVENLAKTANLQEKYTIFTNISRFFAEEEFEPNNQQETATILRVDSKVKGYIHPIGDVDYYKIDLSRTNATELEIRLRGIVKVNTDMVLYDADMQKIAVANSRQSEETESITAKVTSGVYFIKIYDNDGKESNYRDRYELSVISR